MSKEADEVTGRLAVQGLVETAQYSSFTELIKDLPKWIVPKIPKSVTNVVVSNVEPTQKQRNNLWVRLNNGSEFVGIYVYASGSWKPLFPAPNELIWMYGDSRDVPDGYMLADEDNPALPEDLGAALKVKWVRHSSNLYYTAFQVTFVAL